MKIVHEVQKNRKLKQNKKVILFITNRKPYHRNLMVPFSTPMHCVTRNLGSGPHFWNSATFRWITMHVWYSLWKSYTKYRKI